MYALLLQLFVVEDDVASTVAEQRGVADSTVDFGQPAAVRTAVLDALVHDVLGAVRASSTLAAVSLWPLATRYASVIARCGSATAVDGFAQAVVAAATRHTDAHDVCALAGDARFQELRRLVLAVVRTAAAEAAALVDGRGPGAGVCLLFTHASTRGCICTVLALRD